MKHVLIVTYGRSGSTLLQGLLNTIDGWIVRGENHNFVYDLFKSYQALQNTRHKGRGKTSDARNAWFGYETIDPEKYLASLTPLIDDVLLGDANRDHVTCCGFKEIHYPGVLSQDPSGEQLSAFLDFLLACLAPCRIVFLSRDHEQVASSDWWRQKDRSKTLSTLARFDAFADRYSANRADRCFQITYADLVEQTDRFSDLFAFLGVDADPDRVRETLATPHGYNQTSFRAETGRRAR